MTVEEYVIACVHLFGMVHEDRVRFIHNRHHPSDPWRTLPAVDHDALVDQYVYYENGFFIHEAIFTMREMDDHLAITDGKPYYVPDAITLKRHVDEDYVERTPQYERVFELTLALVDGNEQRAEDILFDVVGGFKVGGELSGALRDYVRFDLNADKATLVTLTEALVDLYNHSRNWENNGLTPNELRLMTDHVRTTGRNDPCPCGSGRKYKKCCIDKAVLGDDLGPLSYPDAVFVTEHDIESAYAAVMAAVPSLAEDGEDLDMPSLQDVIHTCFDYHPALAVATPPRLLVAALMRILYRIHGMVDERVDHAIVRNRGGLPDGADVRALADRLESSIRNHADHRAMMTVVERLLATYDAHAIKPAVRLPERSVFTFLESARRRIPYDPDIHDELLELVADMHVANVPLLPVHTYNLLHICPYMHSAMTVYDDVPLADDDRIDLLEGLIAAFVTRHPDELADPPEDFYRIGDNREYILALDTLGRLYKRQGRYEDAHRCYETVLRYDDTDRFRASESILICLLMTKRIDDFNNAVAALPDDSLYRSYLTLYRKLLEGTGFHHAYLDALAKSETVMDVLCGVRTFASVESSLFPAERFLLEDFYGPMTAEGALLVPLVSLHVEGR